MIRCLDAAALAQVLRAEAPAEAAEHVETCARCRKRAALVRDIVASHRGDAELAFRHVRFADHVRRADAARTVDALTAEPVHRWPLIARSDDAVASNAVLGELFRRALASIYSEPHRARAFASAGLEVLRRLRELGSVSAESEAGAYRDAAVVEKICGSTDAALALLDSAKVAAERCADTEYELALVEIRRARWYVDPDSTIEGDAVAIADACEPVFQRRGDTRNARISLLVKGAAFLQLNDPAEAAAVYRRVLSEAEIEGPTFDVASVCQALAIALLALGRADEALPLALRSAETYKCVNAPLAAALSHRTLADAYDALGMYEKALDAIQISVSTLRNAGNLDASIRSELTRIKILLHECPDTDVTDACVAIASKSMQLDSTQRTRRRTATAEALGYLRDAASRRVITVSIVEQVEMYITDLDRGRFAPFMPPVPPLPM